MYVEKAPDFLKDALELRTLDPEYDAARKVFVDFLSRGKKNDRGIFVTLFNGKESRFAYKRTGQFTIYGVDVTVVAETGNNYYDNKSGNLEEAIIEVAIFADRTPDKKLTLQLSPSKRLNRDSVEKLRNELRPINPILDTIKNL